MINKLDSRCAFVRFCYNYSMITDRIVLHSVLSPLLIIYGLRGAFLGFLLINYALYCYGTDFATTASASFFFYFGVKLQDSAVAGSQLLLTLPSLAADSFLLCRRWQTTLHSAVAGRQLSLLCRRWQRFLSILSKNWSLSMCSLRYDWSRRVARS